MAEHEGLPAGSTLRQISGLDNVIAAVEAVAAEEPSGHSSPAQRQRRSNQKVTAPLDRAA